MRGFVTANRHGVLNYTRVRTDFTSGDDKWWTTMLFFYSLWEHIATLTHTHTHTHTHTLSLSLSLSLSLVFSMRFSLRSLSDYRSGIIDKAHSRLRIGTTNQISFVYSCRVCVFVCGRGCACMLTVISHDTGNNVNIRIK